MDGTSEAYGEIGNQHVFGEQAIFDTKTAAHIRRDHCTVCSGRCRRCTKVLDAMRRLRRVPDRQEVFLGLILGQHAPGLQRRWHDALHHICWRTT